MKKTIVAIKMDMVLQQNKVNTRKRKLAGFFFTILTEEICKKCQSKSFDNVPYNYNEVKQRKKNEKSKEVDNEE